MATKTSKIMKNSKTDKFLTSDHLDIFLDILNQKCKKKGRYNFKIYGYNNLIFYIGVYEDQDRIFTFYLHQRQLNFLLELLTFSKDQLFDKIFEAKKECDFLCSERNNIQTNLEVYPNKI
jgi:hypothetical protein